MNIRLICIFLCLFYFKISFSQNDSLPRQVFDTIKFVNGSRQAAKIIEISDKYVKYKNPLNLEGPLFSVRKKDVAGFILKDGCIDMKYQGFEDCVKDPTYGIIEENKFKRKIISADFLQLSNRHLQLNFDFIFKNRKNGLGISGNFGFLDPYELSTYEVLETKFSFTGCGYKKRYLSMDYKFFPTPHKKLTYFCALGIDFGESFFVNSEIVDYYTSTMSGNVRKRRVDKKIYESIYFGYRFNNGFIWRLTTHLICQGIVTIGANHFNYYKAGEKNRINEVHPKISAGFSFGYAF